MHSLARFSVKHPWLIVAAWAMVLAAAAPFALRLSRVAQGGSEAVRGTESQEVMTLLNRDFGRGAAHVVPLVVSSRDDTTASPNFVATIQALGLHLERAPAVRSVTHHWNSGLPELLGRSGHSALLLIQPEAASLIEAENVTARLRADVAMFPLPSGWTVHVTGMSAMFHDLNRRSSADLLRAEAVGIPLTLLVLLLVFRTVSAAATALAVAITAVTVSSALVCIANRWLPASQLAQNVITMIGLGAGTDYALFLLSHYRSARTAGVPRDQAVIDALDRAGPAVLVSGLAVASGFAALFLVHIRFVHSLAFGGITVIAGSLAAALTLLPALLRLGERRILPRFVVAPSTTGTGNTWVRWSLGVMRRPWRHLLLALAITVVCAWPAWRTQAWRIGAGDLTPDAESRRGQELLANDFAAGWMAPVAITVAAPAGATLWQSEHQFAIRQVADALRQSGIVAHVLGFSRLLETLTMQVTVREPNALPPAIASTARHAITAEGKTALVLGVLRDAPETDAAVALIKTLRSKAAEFSARHGTTIQIGGGTAILHDFDSAMFRSIWQVMTAVVVVTFVLLLVHFRSVAVPIKAIVANLLSVFAASGFLVLVFQDGVGSRLLGITPPGGLNSFVVLMLFTILFGLSMDYEIFLLSRIRDEFCATGDNTRAVAAGLSGTAALITSAAAVMVCLFGSFGFFGLTASRQFGLGLAFAVAFDATIIRLLIVPAAMRLLGKWNWWPGSRGIRHSDAAAGSQEAGNKAVSLRSRNAGY